MATPTQSIDCLRDRGLLTADQAAALNMVVVSTPNYKSDLFKMLVGSWDGGGSGPPPVGDNFMTYSDGSRVDYSAGDNVLYNP